MAVVVIDMGSRYVRAGIAGESCPRTIFASGSNTYKRDLNMLELYMFEMLSALWHEVVTARSKDIKVLILEHIVQPRAVRDTLAYVLFKHYKVGSICFYPSLFTPVISTGHKCAIVVDLGARETRAIAVFDSRTILPSLSFSYVGAEMLTETRGPSTKPTLLSVEEYLLTGTTDETHAIELVGTFLGDIEAFDSDEVGGAPGALLECLLKCSIDIRVAVAHNVVYCGGGAAIAGLANAVARAARERILSSDRYQRLRSLLGLIDAQPMRAIDTTSQPLLALMPHPHPFAAGDLAWVGASLLVSSKSMSQRFVREKDIVRVETSTEQKEPQTPSTQTRPVYNIPDWQSVSESDWRFVPPVHPYFAASVL